MGKKWKQCLISYSWDPKINADGDCSHEIKRCLLLGKAVTNLDRMSKSRDITLLTKIHIVKAIVFPVVMYGCESWTVKEGWAPKNWCFQTVVLEKTLEGPLDSKEIQPVSPKGDQSRVLIGKTDAEAEHSNTLATGFEEPAHWKRPWCWEWLRARGEGAAEEETVGDHHWLNGHEFEQTQGDSVGQGSLTCYSSRGHKELDVT